MRAVLRTMDQAETQQDKKQVKILGRSHQHKVFTKYGTYERHNVHILDDMPSWAIDSSMQPVLLHALLEDVEDVKDEDTQDMEYTSLCALGLTLDQSRWIHNQVCTKVRGYVQQDQDKKKTRKKQNKTFACHESPITLLDTLHMLNKEDCKCHYCRVPLHILYRNTREPAQWSLDRIDNARGHDVHNVVVSCYACNVRRRQRSYHKFKQEYQACHMTKQEP